MSTKHSSAHNSLRPRAFSTSIAIPRALNLSCSGTISSLGSISPSYFAFSNNYGFPHKGSSQAEQYEGQQSTYTQESTGRIPFWQSQLWDKQLYREARTKSPRLLAELRYGVPPVLRRDVWFHLSGAARKQEKAYTAYESLLDVRIEDETVLPRIEKDLDRTYPEHPFFKEAGARQKLYRVLRAFAARSRAVGYCQGLNFLAGLLLIVYHGEEAPAFWTLAAAIEEKLEYYFTPKMIAPAVDQKVLWDMLVLKFPKLSCHLQDVGFSIQIIVTSWLLSLFATSGLPWEGVFRVWECFFVLGVPFVLQVALALFRGLHDQLMLAQSTEDVLVCVSGGMSEMGLDGVNKMLDFVFDDLQPSIGWEMVSNLGRRHWQECESEMLRIDLQRQVFFVKGYFKDYEKNAAVVYQKSPSLVSHGSMSSFPSAMMTKSSSGSWSSFSSVTTPVLRRVENTCQNLLWKIYERYKIEVEKRKLDERKFMKCVVRKTLREHFGQQRMIKKISPLSDFYPTDPNLRKKFYPSLLELYFLFLRVVGTPLDEHLRDLLQDGKKS
eukprot:TRINITY_DN12193_c0_g1_i1.p1 TRINITY_DN12193_c0_g1~~TRINITY_DN12193_c0_g1_i1.p1  ORF type:complete len:550 (+),score=109.10 TRINITY_DN12193_c0_g1_i1:73-1722(+)